MIHESTENIESKLVDAYVETFKFFIDNQTKYEEDGSFKKIVMPWFNKKITLATGHNSNYIDASLLSKVNEIITNYSISMELRYKHKEQQSYEILFKPK